MGTLRTDGGKPGARRLLDRVPWDKGTRPAGTDDPSPIRGAGKGLPRSVHFLPIVNPVKHSAKPVVGTACAVFYIFLWASPYVPSKVASTQSPPLWFLAAGMVLVCIAAALGRPWPRRLSDWAFGAVLGLFGNALYLGLTYTALHRLSAGLGAIILGIVLVQRRPSTTRVSGQGP